MAEGDFDKTVRLNPAGIPQGSGNPDADKTFKIAPQSLDSDKTVRLTPAMEKPIPLSPSQAITESELPPVLSMIPDNDDEDRQDSKKLKTIIFVILFSALLGGTWFFAPKILSNKALELSKVGGHAKAAQLLKFALYVYPLKETEIRVSLGKEQRLSNNLPGARASLEKVLAKAPGHYDAMRELGLTFLSLGENQKAFELLNACAQSKPDDREIVRQAAILAFDAGDFATASTLIQNFTRIGGSAKDYNMLGIALEKTGKIEPSVSAFETALSKDSSIQGANLSLAKAFLLKGDYAKALEHSENELKLSPGNQAAISILAESSIKCAEKAIGRKNYEEAEGYLKRGLAVPSDLSAKMNYELAKVGAARNRLGDVLKSLSEAAKMDKNLKRQALRDKSFVKYRKNPGFIKITR